MNVTHDYIMQKGKMIAYYGNLHFEAMGSSALDMAIGHAFNAPLYGHQFVLVSGYGKLILGDMGNNIASYDLDHANMTVKVDNLLAFEPTLTCEECIIPGYVTLLGSGKMLASSSGPVHFMEPPVKVDEDALLGWADCPTPSWHHDYGYVRDILSMGGAVTGLSATGEEKQINFTGQGTVLIQSSEDKVKGRGGLDRVISQMGNLVDRELEQLRDVIGQRLNRR